MSYVFSAEGMGRSFGRNEVLTSASLWATAGRVTTLMGRNGAGKTTLLRVATGCLAAHHGVVRFQGQAWERPRLWRLARMGLFYVPQEQLLVGARTPRQHLEAVGARYGRGRVSAAVDETRIGDVLDQRVWELSGGERMRVSLSLAMARMPACLLIDEPLARVSPTDRDILSTALRTLADEGVAVVATGHDARALLALSDEIIWCVAGTTHHLGSPGEAVRHGQFVREYLGPGFADLRDGGGLHDGGLDEGGGRHEGTGHHDGGGHHDGAGLHDNGEAEAP